MNKALKLLAAITISGIAIYGLIDLYKKGKLDSIINKFKKIEEPLESGLYTTNQLRIIAKDLTNNIKKTEGRISDKGHDKNLKKYEKMNWSQKILSRMNNSNLN